MKRTWKAGRWFMGLLALFLILVFLVMALPSGRGFLLRQGLERAAKILPGQMVAQQAEWPDLDRLQIQGLTWTAPDSAAEADTLLSLRHLELKVDLGDLFGRRLGIHRLAAGIDQLDVVGISEAMPATPASSADSSATPAFSLPYFREGSWPGLPAAYLDTLDLVLHQASLPDSLEIHDLTLLAGIDLRPENPTSAWLKRTSGKATAHLPDPVTVALDHLQLNLDTFPTKGQPQEIIAQVEGAFTLPGPADWPGLPPAPAGAVPAEPTQGTLTARLEINADAWALDQAQYRVDLAQTPWLDRGVIHGLFQQGQAQIDTLDVALLGAELMASGTADTSRANLDFQLVVAEDHQLNSFLGPEYQDYRWTTRLRGHLEGPVRRPDLQVNLEAALTTPDLSIPRLRARGQVWGDSLRVYLDADEKMQLSTLPLDSLRTSVKSTRPLGADWVLTSAPAFTLQAWEADRQVGLGGKTWGDTVRTVRLDSLRVRTGNQEGKLARPMTLTYDRLARLVKLDGLFTMPCPTDWSGLPEAARSVAADQDCQGTLEARVTLSPGLNSIDEAQLRMDLGRSSWLDRGLARGTYRQGQVVVDTLDLALLGAGLTASGTADTQQIDLDFLLVLDEEHQLNQFLEPEFQDYRVAGQLQGHLSGPVRRLDMDLDLQASVDSPQLVLPRLTAQGKAQGDSLAVTLRADQKILLGTQPMDSLVTRWETIRPPAGSWNLDAAQSFLVHAWSPEIDLSFGGAASGDTIRTVRLDSMEVRIQKQKARLAQPMSLTYAPADRSVTVEGLDILGDPGHLEMGGFVSPGGIDMTASWDMLFTEAILQVLYPSPVWSQNEGMDIALKGEADLQGTPRGPRFSGGLQAAMEPHGSTPPLSAQARFQLDQGDSSGLAAEMRLDSGNLLLLKGRALWPGHANLKTGTWVPDSTSGPRIDFPQQTIDLAALKTLFPGTFGLEGKLGVALKLGAHGSRQSNWEGKVSTAGVRVDLPNSSRVSLEMDTRVSGPALNPRWVGSVKVSSGFIRIPEIPRNLLPVEGSSLLWAAMESTPEPGAFGWVSEEADQGPSLESSSPPYLPDLDLDVILPGGLVVHGYGLNVDLEGQLKVTRGMDPDGHPVPSLSGHIGVNEGNLKFMNRLFNFTQAEILFRNQIPANPRLNVNLETEVANYLVRIEVRGTGLNPEIVLVSEPELQQADIMALLLFGQTSSDLDNDERGRIQRESTPAQQLQQNLAALAVVFGTSGVQNSVSSTLGVDMVEFGSGTDGDSTLMVGKYLRPRILVKYHQSLEKSGTYFMTLDYTINKFFKLVSTYGQGEEDSGLELKWTRRY
nr:translocation/assembly module TamB domain-containing protein [Candidatus Krumholzibacteria bacterium]